MIPALAVMTFGIAYVVCVACCWSPFKSLNWTILDCQRRSVAGSESRWPSL